MEAPTVHCGQGPKQSRDQRFYYNFDILFKSGHPCIMPGVLALCWASKHQGTPRIVCKLLRLLKDLSTQSEDTGRTQATKRKGYYLGVTTALCTSESLPLDTIWMRRYAQTDPKYHKNKLLRSVTTKWDTAFSRAASMSALIKWRCGVFTHYLYLN